MISKNFNGVGDHSRISVDVEGAKLGGYSRVVPSAIVWQGRLENGSVAASGCYTLKICALRLWGTEEDCIHTPESSILYD